MKFTIKEYSLKSLFQITMNENKIFFNQNLWENGNNTWYDINKMHLFYGNLHKRNVK